MTRDRWTRTGLQEGSVEGVPRGPSAAVKDNPHQPGHQRTPDLWNRHEPSEVDSSIRRDDLVCELRAREEAVFHDRIPHKQGLPGLGNEADPLTAGESVLQRSPVSPT